MTQEPASSDAPTQLCPHCQSSNPASGQVCQHCAKPLSSPSQSEAPVNLRPPTHWGRWIGLTLMVLVGLMVLNWRMNKEIDKEIDFAKFSPVSLGPPPLPLDAPADADSGDDVELIVVVPEADSFAKCQGGDKKVCHMLCYGFVAHVDAKISAEQGLTACQKGCDLGKAQSCTLLGMKYRISVEEGADARALALFKKGCAGGDKASCALMKEALEQ